MGNFLQQWNALPINSSVGPSIFAQKGQILLGTKVRHDRAPREIWQNQDAFLRNGVSIPFRADIRKPARIILIGGSRIGKTTLKSRIIDPLQNDFRVPTLSLYPKGMDAIFHNRQGNGSILCPGETNRTLRNDLYIPEYSFQQVADELKKLLKANAKRFAFELYDFDPNNDPGFLENDPKEYPQAVYTNLSIILDKNPHLKRQTCARVMEEIEKITFFSKKGDKDTGNKIFLPFTTYESLKTRLQGAISKKFLCESKNRLDVKTFINGWESGRSHAVMFFADSNDPRVQSYSAKIIRIANEAKLKHNAMRMAAGKRPKPLWLVVDDARELVNSSMEGEKFRARKEIERCIYMYGENGWNVMLTYHNAEDVPRGLMKEADFIICSRLDSNDAAMLPDYEFRDVVQNLFIKPYYYYNEWAVRSKDGQIRRFYAIDSRVGLR